MLARCARCQGTFTTERFGVQPCPLCGSEILLADPKAPPPAPGAAAPPPQPPQAAPPPPPMPPGDPGQPPPGWGAAPPPPGAPPPPPPGSWGPQGHWPQPPGSPGYGQQGALPAPFTNRRRLGLVSTFFETFKMVLAQPADFFRRVRVDQTGSAVLFGVLGFSVGSVASAIYSFLTRATTLTAMQGLMKDLPAQQQQFLQGYLESMSGSGVVAQILLAPVLGLVAIYLSAGIIHLGLTVVRGAHRRFDATLTVVGYATGLYLIMAVPGCGGLIALLAWLAVVIIGTAEAHRCGVGRAAVAVLGPGLLVSLCCCGLLGVGMATMMKSMGTTGVPGQTTTL